MKTFMKFSFLIILFSLLSTKASTQEPNENERPILSQFMENYNIENYKKIYNILSPELQEAFSYENLVTYLSEEKQRRGDIKKFIFEDHQQSFSLYTLELYNGIRSLIIGVDTNSKITGFQIRSYFNPNITRNKTNYILPFHGEWNVFWGGDTEGVNYHILHEACQRGGIDFLIIKDRFRFNRNTEGKKNEDYYAFGKEIIAPCAGEVIIAWDGVPDNIVGKEWNPEEPFGNFVMLLTETQEYIVLAHLKQYSVKVKPRDKIEQGQAIGLCGNSGKSYEPHLHIHVQDKENFDEAVAIKCYFDSIYVNGDLKTEYSPVQKDIVGNK